MTLMTLLAVIAFSALSVVVAIFLARCWFEELYGDLATHWLLSREILQTISLVLLLGLAVLVGMKVLAKLNPDVLMLPAFGIGLGALWAAWWIVARERSKCGKVLVDLGQSEPRGMIAVVVFGVLGLGAIVLGLMQGDPFLALQALFFFSSALMSYLITGMHTLLTEKGIYTPNGTLAWPRVEAYRWTGGTGKSHTLVLGVKRRIFKTRILRVPWQAFDDVSNVMEDYVGALLFEHPPKDEPENTEASN